MTQAALPDIKELDAFLRRCRADRRVYVETFFKIRPREQGAGLVPFHLTKAQGDYWEKAHRKGWERGIILKARQVAVTSVVQADFLADAMLDPGTNVLFICQKPEEQNLPAHRERMRLFYDSVPEFVKPSLNVANQSHWELLFPNGEKSNIYFSTSGTVELGQGGTYHRAHLTDFAGFEPNEADILFKNLSGMPFGSRVVIESRPNGAKGPFFEQYRLARAGQTVYRPFFYPWFWEPSYTVDAGYLGRVPKLTEHEAKLVQQHGLSMEQIAWRRYMVKVLGSEEPFLEQYAEDDETCFLLAGQQAFDTLYIQRLLGEAKEPVSRRGHLRIYLPPQEGETYAVGVDPAMGLKHSDDTAAIVRKARTWEHVATVQGKIAPREMAGIVAKLATEYNDAVVCVERNANSFGLQDVLMTDFNYPNIYIHFKGIMPSGDDNYGFPTNPLTKPWIVSKERELVAQQLWTSHDRELLGQMRMYEESDNKFGAEQDDLVSADLCCLAARDQALAMRPRSGRQKAKVSQTGW